MFGSPNAKDSAGVNIEDLELVRESLAGEPKRQEHLVDRMKCVPRILSAANRKMGNPIPQQDLVDITQDVLVVIWRKLSQFEGRSSLETWIYRISCLELMNTVRKKSRRRHQEELEESEIVDRLGATSSEFLHRDFKSLYAALDQLDSEDTQIVRYKNFDELTFREIGERLDLSANTVKSRYYRALRSLLELLRDSEEGMIS